MNRLFDTRSGLFDIRVGGSSRDEALLSPQPFFTRAGVHARSRRAGMPLPGLVHSDERPIAARFPRLPDAHGRRVQLRAHARRIE